MSGIPLNSLCNSETGWIWFRGVRFQTPSSVSFSGLTEFRGANSVSSFQPIICVQTLRYRWPFTGVSCRTHRVGCRTQWALSSETVLSKQYSARSLYNAVEAPEEAASEEQQPQWAASSNVLCCLCCCCVAVSIQLVASFVARAFEASRSQEASAEQPCQRQMHRTRVVSQRHKQVVKVPQEGPQ